MTDKPTLNRRARELRSHLTEAEQTLWLHLRLRNIANVRFLRQRVIGNYILDFYAPSLRLAIEVDGGQHFDENALAYDSRRDAWLQAQGIALLRFTNPEVLKQRDAVLEEIERTVRRLRKHPPVPAARPPSFRRG